MQLAAMSIILVLLSIASHSLSHLSTRAYQARLATGETASTTVEAQKLILEKEKFEFEKAKHRDEITLKNREDFYDFLKVLAAAIGLGIPIWLAVWQARVDRQKRIDEEKLQTQLKAAEIAMDATESSHVRARAQMVAALFRGRLPENFASGLDATDIRFGPGTQLRLELLKLLAEHPEERGFLVAAWEAMWPGDKDPSWKPPVGTAFTWLTRLQSVVNEKVPGP